MKSCSWLVVALTAYFLQGRVSLALTNGYLTAVLRSGCASAPQRPPSVGEIMVGADYVIITVANGDPLDFQNAQRVVTDAVFESLMPLYCDLPDGRCVENRVQWNIVTYSAEGNRQVSGCAASGCGFHYCSVTDGYITAVIRGESASVPLPPPVGQIAVGADAVIMTIADGDPTDLGTAQRLATDAVFESLMRRYCALPRGSGAGYTSGHAQWNVVTFDAEGNAMLSACAASGCDFHDCVVAKGYITATLRSPCTGAPPRPPPPGGITVGPDYVIMTVADGDPLDYQAAQHFATDAVFESLMPLYCSLPRSACVTNPVQWNILTYDAGGNPRVSACATSGCGSHDFDGCLLTPPERIQQILVWLDVDVAAGILDRHENKRLSSSLNAALRDLVRGNTQRAINRLQGFVGEVDRLVGTGQLPAIAAQPLRDAALGIISEAGG